MHIHLRAFLRLMRLGVSSPQLLELDVSYGRLVSVHLLHDTLLQEPTAPVDLVTGPPDARHLHLRLSPTHAARGIIAAAAGFGRQLRTIVSLQSLHDTLFQEPTAPWKGRPLTWPDGCTGASRLLKASMRFDCGKVRAGALNPGQDVISPSLLEAQDKPAPHWCNLTHKDEGQYQSLHRICRPFSTALFYYYYS